VVEGIGGEGEEYRGLKAELGEAASSLGSGQRKLAPMGPRWQSGRAQWWRACTGTKAKWGRPSSARRGAEIRPGARGVVATNDVQLPPCHRSRCRARAWVTGASHLSGSCG
jgi:hypothetical protein